MSTNERAQQKTIDENKKQDNENNKKEYVLNKIFSGSFCDHELPHDVINFIKSDEGYRFAYVNPYGKTSEPNIRYIFHIIKSSLYGDNNKGKNCSVYELAAVSEIEKPTQKEDASPRKIKGIEFEKIFTGGKGALKELFKVSHLWRPKGKPILIIPNQKKLLIMKMQRMTASK